MKFNHIILASLIGVSTALLHSQVATAKLKYAIATPNNQRYQLNSQKLKQLKTPDANDYLDQGLDQYEKGNYPEAIADYTAALKINPLLVQAYYLRAIARSRLEDHREDYDAIADYTAALRINPQLTKVYYLRGNTHTRLGYYQEAIADYTAALKINPHNAELYDFRGKVNARLGANRDAMADFQQAANLFQQQGNRELYEKALESLRRIQEL
ncbi:MAG TPA: tetratricopeptide repeat protein [Nodularia sp. (in: cyanobacteria)]|nr:tetratricopeptide repeat protein [Nodularia sp. (in: cyanobacteria)]